MMYLFMYIIGQYYIINPIIEFTWPSIKLKNLPPEMWTLLTVAVGGYITSRGVEKGSQLLTIDCDGDIRADVARVVISAGAELLELGRDGDGLESIFMSLVRSSNVKSAVEDIHG